MSNQLRAGLVLVRADAVLPASLPPLGDLVAPGWKILSGADAGNADREISRAGWHFFFVVPPAAAAKGFSRDRQEAARRALAKVARQAEAQHLNAIEITKIAWRRFWPFWIATVAINFRHIGETPFLFDTKLGAKDSEQSAMSAKAA
jgi:hypothetical protein